MMKMPPRPLLALAALFSVMASAVVLLAASGPLRSADAQVSTRPSECVCSDRTSITGFEVKIAQCQCGSMTCAVTELAHSGSRSNQLQCR
jgi:hypothetical protein